MLERSEPLPLSSAPAEPLVSRRTFLGSAAGSIAALLTSTDALSADEKKDTHEKPVCWLNTAGHIDMDDCSKSGALHPDGRHLVVLPSQGLHERGAEFSVFDLAKNREILRKRIMEDGLTNGQPQ